ncbi:uncharacterized protein LOC134980790 [Pseudophryne corroboree]|uniref:uncharacterized protein LOC134980790 n=1 Tax=Pseudophryne corroboree TaxID=495146 RepID=UPI0030813746
MNPRTRKGVSGETLCGERRNVSGIEGGEVTLPVGETGIRDISWVAGMRLIVITEPGKPVVVRETLYRGRLSVTADGSLIISNLSRDDQGIYTANIQRQLSGPCIQIYDLRVYGVPGSSCGERREVSGIEGGDVTLPVGDTGIRDDIWVTDMRLIAKTEPGNPVMVHNNLYRGRLSVTADGSLIITNLSREDQGNYTANIRRQISGQCTQIYDLTVHGRTQKRDYRGMIIIRLTLSACVFCLTCCVFLHHVIMDSKDNLGITVKPLENKNQDLTCTAYNYTVCGSMSHNRSIARVNEVSVLVFAVYPVHGVPYFVTRNGEKCGRCMYTVPLSVDIQYTTCAASSHRSVCSCYLCLPASEVTNMQDGRKTLQLLIPTVVILYLHSCLLCDALCDKRSVSGVEGGNVTLQVDLAGIKSISWYIFQSIYIIAITKPGRYIDDVDEEYKGRVHSTADGSLHITDLTSDDQRSYRATVQRDGGQRCLLFHLTVYRRLSAGDIQISHNFTSSDPCAVALMCTVTVRDVTVTWDSIDSSDINVTGDVLYVPPSDVNFTYTCTARNPISNSYKTVVPQHYCNPDGKGQLHISYTPVTIMRLALSAAVFLVTCCVLTHHMRTEVTRPSADSS